MADDDLLLDSKDLLDIFGSEETKDSDTDKDKSLEDLFFSDDEEKAPEAAALPQDVVEPEAPAASEEPLVEDRKGMTEDEWRNSSEYEEFKKQVIARHLRKKAEEEAAKRKKEEQAEEERMRKEAEEEARRKAELVEKYKQAKAATIAQRAQAILSEADKETAFKEHLAALKEKMSLGKLPKLSLSSAPEASASFASLDLDVNKCKQLAGMAEDTREELLAQAAEKIGVKPARTMMKKTLAKMAKLHQEVFGRASVNSKGELREDGALDEDLLARSFYALPAENRMAMARKALYELTEMRFIAIELGLGAQAKGFVVGRALDALEKRFAKKAYDATLSKWYRSDVIPATALSEGEEGSA